MTELYLRLVGRLLTPFLLVMAGYFLLRGHDEPGGGFVAALIVASALTIQILVKGATEIRRRYGRFLRPTIGAGLLVAVGAASLGMITGAGFFHSLWVEVDIASLHLELGTPQLFDLGVFLTVCGVSSSFILGLSETILEAPGEDTDEVLAASPIVPEPDLSDTSGERS
jgi:multicomponent Na+:H+ antiporter subunit B